MVMVVVIVVLSKNTFHYYRHDARTSTTSLLASSINAQKIKISVLIELKTTDRRV